LTSPIALPHHVLLRKVYALAAFALLGVLLEKSQLPRLRGPVAAALAIGLYSWAIEFGQMAIDHVAETFAQHAFDVASGVVGGAIGVFVLRVWARGRMQRSEIILTVLSLGLLAAVFPVIYGR